MGESIFISLPESEDVMWDGMWLSNPGRRRVRPENRLANC